MAACLLGGFVASSEAGPPSQYSAEAIRATVIDAETKQPLEGVVVVAHWQLFYSTVGGRVPAGQLEVMEAVTDQDGKFSFPAWGPKKIPKYNTQINDSWIGHIPLFTPDAYLDDLDPALILFKPGYEYRRLQNPTRSTTDHSPVRRSMWNGRTVALKPFKGTGEEYAEHVHQLDNDLEWARYGEGCEWKQVPRMLVVIHRLSEQFESQGVKLKGWRGGARIRKVTNVGKQSQCGSAEEFFRGYLP